MWGAWCALHSDQRPDQKALKSLAKGRLSGPDFLNTIK